MGKRVFTAENIDGTIVSGTTSTLSKETKIHVENETEIIDADSPKESEKKKISPRKIIAEIISKAEMQPNSGVNKKISEMAPEELYEFTEQLRKNTNNSAKTGHNPFEKEILIQSVYSKLQKDV